jgi:hypothetical protein
VWAQPPLIPLLQTMQGIDQLLPLHDGTPEAEFDMDVEIMELPYIFRTTLGTLPAEVPYVHVEPMPLSSSNAPLAVGLVWYGGDWDKGRSMPFALLAPFAQLQGIQFYILQSEAKSAGWCEELGVCLETSSLFEDARIIRALDVLISVDTMPAHLAGALGVPVWTLLQAEADWRWMENQDTSPWYPTMRLFRQQCPGKWEPVIERVTDALEKLRNLSKINLHGKVPTL